MSERINFQSWWNDGPFRTDGPYGPLRTTYAKLNKAEADPDHIKALCNCLELGDLLCALLSDMVALSRTKRKKQSYSSKRTLPLREMNSAKH
jgi:hypothetical protein